MLHRDAYLTPASLEETFDAMEARHHQCDLRRGRRPRHILAGNAGKGPAGDQAEGARKARGRGGITLSCAAAAM
jgi:hypothetical protein